MIQILSIYTYILLFDLFIFLERHFMSSKREVLFIPDCNEHHEGHVPGRDRESDHDDSVS